MEQVDKPILHILSLSRVAYASLREIKLFAGRNNASQFVFSLFGELYGRKVLQVAY
jgi:hypothetical protein